MHNSAAAAQVALAPADSCPDDIVVTAPELLEACKQHSSPALKL
jgi:hypothetical protein